MTMGWCHPELTQQCHPELTQQCHPELVSGSDTKIQEEIPKQVLHDNVYPSE